MEEIKVTPQTSILIVSRNRGEALRRTLTSLQPLADPAQLEVLVVDNASTDGSATIDAEFPFVRMLRMQRDCGFTKAVNIGTRTSTGDYLCLCPLGIEFQPDTLPALRAAVEGGALAATPLVVDATGGAITRLYPLPDAEAFRSFWKSGDRGPAVAFDPNATEVRAEYIVGSPVLLRRQSIVGMNYLDERYGQFWSDAEICTQVRRAGKPLVLLPKLQVTGEAIPDAGFARLTSESAKYSADAAIGGAAYLSKHRGFMAGAMFRLGATASSLGSALLGTLTFQQPGAKWARFLNLAAGQKIDGNQGG